MMQLQFTVRGQHIVRTDFSYVVAGSRRYMSCAFDFDTDWDGVLKTAVFEKEGVAYHVILQDDAIAPAAMPVLSEGVWRVSVFGGNLITADSAPLAVFASGYTEENAPEPPSASVYETLTSMVTGIADKTEALEKKIEGGGAGGTAVTVSGDTLFLGGA